jgi:4-hydroxybenzoate polyprenyltransferase
MPEQTSFLKLYSTLSRFEFLPAISVAILIGIFLGLDTFGDIFSLDVILVIVEGLIIFYLLFNTGFMINCWADWEVDEIYKKDLASAVRAFGRQKLLNLVIAHIVTAIILTVHLTLIHNFRPEIFVMVIVGIFLGVAYSVKPFQFKAKGGAHAVMAIPVFAIPGSFAFLLVSTIDITELYSQMFLLLVVGITCAHYALVLISQSEDYPEDKSAGLRTPPVAWGLTKALRVSLTLNIFGSLCSLTAFVLIFYSENIFLLILAPVLAIALFFPTRTINHLYSHSLLVKSNEKILKEIRKHMPNYPKWHAIPLGMIMVCSLLLLIVRSM